MGKYVFNCPQIGNLTLVNIYALADLVAHPDLRVGDGIKKAAEEVDKIINRRADVPKRVKLTRTPTV